MKDLTSSSSFRSKGYRKTYDDEAIKAGMIGSITNNARDYLDFVGFDKDLPVLIEALRHDMGRGKPLTNCSRSFTNLRKNQ